MQRLDLGLLRRDTLAISHRHFAVFATLAAAFIFIPGAVFGFVFPRYVTTILIRDPMHPSHFPLSLWVAIIVIGFLIAIGWFSIAAITADPREGAGRSIGATIAGAAPKIGKAIVACLWLILAEASGIAKIVIIAGIIGLIAALGGAKLTPGAPGSMLVGFTAFGVAIIFTFWLMTRLAPLLGVLLREPLSAFASIERAWQLSRGSGWRIFVLLFAVSAASLAVQIALYLLARAIGDDIAALPFVLVRSGFGAWLAIYVAAAYGILYRQLAERD